MTLEHFNLASANSATSHFYSRRTHHLPANTTFWLVRDSAISRATFLTAHVLGVSERSDVSTTLLRAVERYDLGIPQIPHGTSSDTI